MVRTKIKGPKKSKQDDNEEEDPDFYSMPTLPFAPMPDNAMMSEMKRLRLFMKNDVQVPETTLTRHVSAPTPSPAGYTLSGNCEVPSFHSSMPQPWSTMGCGAPQSTASTMHLPNQDWTGCSWPPNDHSSQINGWSPHQGSSNNHVQHSFPQTISDCSAGAEIEPTVYGSDLKPYNIHGLERAKNTFEQGPGDLSAQEAPLSFCQPVRPDAAKQAPQCPSDRPALSRRATLDVGMAARSLMPLQARGVEKLASSSCPSLPFPRAGRIDEGQRNWDPSSHGQVKPVQHSSHPEDILTCTTKAKIESRSSNELDPLPYNDENGVAVGASGDDEFSDYIDRAIQLL